MKKTLLALLAVVLVAVISVSGTLAWLTDSTEAVENTFTVGNIDISLGEGDNLDLKMVPGKTLTKDPLLTVEAGSEACYVFVKVEKSNNFDTFMEYTMADGWAALSGVDGVYYRTCSASTSDQEFAILANDQVTVKSTVTKAQLDALTSSTYPTLTFTGYAVQLEGVSSASDAWALL